MVIPPDIGLGLVTTYEHEYPFFSVSSFPFLFFFLLSSSLLPLLPLAQRCVYLVLLDILLFVGIIACKSC